MNRFQQAREAAKKQFSSLGQGYTRWVFDLGDGYVLKIPQAEWCEQVNVTEAAVYLADTTRKYAHCFLVEFEGVAALVMEKVEPISEPIKGIVIKGVKLPKWTGRIDCHQVGFNQEGHIVAFDYGSSISPDLVK